MTTFIFDPASLLCTVYQSVQNATAIDACYWLEENGAHHADPEVSALTDSATGDLQAGNSGAQMH